MGAMRRYRDGPIAPMGRSCEFRFATRVMVFIHAGRTHAPDAWIMRAANASGA